MHVTKFQRFLPLAGIPAAIFFAASDWTIFSIPSIEGVGKQQAYVDWVITHTGRFTLAAISAVIGRESGESRPRRQVRPADPAALARHRPVGPGPWTMAEDIRL